MRICENKESKSQTSSVACWLDGTVNLRLVSASLSFMPFYSILMPFSYLPKLVDLLEQIRSTPFQPSYYNYSTNSMFAFKLQQLKHQQMKGNIQTLL
jgi:hypothetical protein